MAVPQRSASMDALRRNGFTVWPGMTIYWIGDPAHQSGVSGHNPDDTPGVQAELSDADSVPEVRALDFMIGPMFSTEDGWRLVNALVAGQDKWRLYYVIWQRAIWHRGTSFQARPYTGSNPHTDHVHVSGYSTDDANGSDWTSVLSLGEEPPLTPAEIAAVANAVWARAINSPSLLRQAPAADWIKDAYSLANNKADGTVAILNQIKATLDGIAASPPGGLTEAQVRAIVREEVRAELDRTHLIGG